MRSPWHLVRGVDPRRPGSMPTIRPGNAPRLPAKRTRPRRASIPVTNGFEDQAAFDKDRKTFEEVEEITPNGLGPGL